MKKNILITATCFFAAVTISFAQKPKSYTGGRFALDIAGSRALLDPVEQGDTLTYTINKLSDSVLVKKKFQTIPIPPGKKYYLKFKVKKKTS
jgi:hypothetical protein